MLEELWKFQQVRIKMTGGKERQWIENALGFFKDKLGLAKIKKVFVICYALTI